MIRTDRGQLDGPGDRPVLVTGAAGFVGSHLAESLVAGGTRVIGIDSFDPFYDRSVKLANVAGLDADRFELIEADVNDAAAMRDIVERARPSVVYHLAALVGVRPSIDEPDRYVAVNVGGTTSVLEAARHAGVARFVFASSSSVYGNNRKIPFAEDDALEGCISPYAATKRAGELLCQTYSHLYGMRIGCTRLFTVYGPRQRPDLAIGRFLRAIGSDEPITMYGDGTSSRDHTFVSDVVAGLRAAAARLDDGKTAAFRIWNIGGAHPVTLRQLVDEIASVVGATPRIRRQPAQAGDVDRTSADLARSHAELGYAPTIALREGLARQWSWMRRATASLPPAPVLTVGTPSRAEVGRR